MANKVSKKERKAKKVQEKAQFAEIDRRLEQGKRFLFRMKCLLLQSSHWVGWILGVCSSKRIRKPIFLSQGLKKLWREERQALKDVVVVAERRQTEAAEVARLKLEAKLAYEAEQAWLKAEEERLAEESQSMRSFLEWRNTTLAKLEAEALAVTDVSPRSQSHSALCKTVDSLKMCRLLKKCHGFFLPARRDWGGKEELRSI